MAVSDRLRVPMTAEIKPTIGSCKRINPPRWEVIPTWLMASGWNADGLAPIYQGFVAEKNISFFVAKVALRDFVTLYECKGPRRYSKRSLTNVFSAPHSFNFLFFSFFFNVDGVWYMQPIKGLTRPLLIRLAYGMIRS